MKQSSIFFLGFIPVFSIFIFLNIFNGIGADSIQELVIIYLLSPAFYGIIGGGISLLLHKIGFN